MQRRLLGLGHQVIDIDIIGTREFDGMGADIGRCCIASAQAVGCGFRDGSTLVEVQTCGGVFLSHYISRYEGCLFLALIVTL